MTGRVVLTAPTSGWLLPLDAVPDAAFAEGMVGAGAAIDPTDGVLRAPCDGDVVMVADARHALTIAAGNGALILLHVGIDTVGLKGEGLAVRVAVGDRVRAGEPLIEADLDRLVYRASSLVTPVVVTNAGDYRVQVPAANCLIEAGQPFFEIERAADSGERGALPSSGPDAVQEVRIALEHGFHARPAARIARATRRYRSRIVIAAAGREADAASTVALMGLGVGSGDRVELRGYGEDAAEAVRALAAEIESGLGEKSAGPAPPVIRKAGAKPPWDSGGLRGVVASRGIAVGVAARFEMPPIEIPETGAGVDVERARLERARQAARDRLEQLARTSRNEILDAQLEILDDPGLAGDAEQVLQADGSAGYAWRQAIGRAQDALLATGDARLAERVADLRDVEYQVLDALRGNEDPAPVELPDGAIVLAAELLPSQLGRLDPARVAGFCTAGGGPTSHVALLAASLGIPAIVGAGPGVLQIANGTRVLLDAEAGTLKVEPGEAELAAARATTAARREAAARHLEDARAECYTADGCRIHVLANLASPAEARDAVARGAEGCGLLRTEFLFHGAAAAPTVDAQAAVYQEFADLLGGRPLVIRTLDAGGDKPLAYLPLPREDNPLLGLRGLRVGLRFPQLLRDQLTAILRVSPENARRVLLPMVTEAGELRAVRAMIDEIGARHRLEIGAMIETPASVVLADSIAGEADFLSIGTNDLAQYTLATDRAHPELAGAFDSFHPAVLHQVAAVCQAAGRHGCAVSVCGALASDPDAAPILIGLGVRALSAVPAVIPELKALIRQLSMPACTRLAQAALEQEDAPSLRALVAGAGAAEGGRKQA